MPAAAVLNPLWSVSGAKRLEKVVLGAYTLQSGLMDFGKTGPLKVRV